MGVIEGLRRYGIDAKKVLRFGRDVSDDIHITVGGFRKYCLYFVTQAAAVGFGDVKRCEDTRNALGGSVVDEGCVIYWLWR